MDTPAHGRKMDRKTVIDNTIKQNTGIKNKLLLHVTTGMNLNNTVWETEAKCISYKDSHKMQLCWRLRPGIKWRGLSRVLTDLGGVLCNGCGVVKLVLNLPKATIKVNTYNGGTVFAVGNSNWGLIRMNNVLFRHTQRGQINSQINMIKNKIKGRGIVRRETVD